MGAQLHCYVTSVIGYFFSFEKAFSKLFAVLKQQFLQMLLLTIPWNKCMPSVEEFEEEHVSIVML